jgi:outer membrane protein
MKKISLILAIALTVPASAADLVEVLQRSKSSDPQLAAAKHQTEAKQEVKKQALSAFLPQINGSAGRSKTKTDLNFGQFGNIPVPDSEREFWQVALQQSIYNQGNIENYRIAKLQTALAAAEYDAAYQDFLLRVAKAYFGVLNAEDSLRFAKAELKAMKRQWEQAEQRFKVGLAAITDVHEAKASYDAARARVIVAEKTLQDAREALYAIAKEYYVDLKRPPEDMTVSEDSLPPLKAKEETAMAKNPNLGQARIGAEMAEKTVKLRRAGHFPTLGLSYNHNNSTQFDQAIRDPDPNSPTYQEIIALVDQDTVNRNLSLNLNVPIYSGGRVSSQTRQARKEYEAAMDRLEQAQRSTIQQVRSAWYGLKAAISGLEARKQAVISAKAALEATQAGYEVGTRTIVDVLIAQRGLYQAQRDYAKAKYDYLQAVLGLERAAGTLSDDDVQNINQLLTETGGVNAGDA